MKIGIISSSMRKGSSGDQIAEWIHEKAINRNGDVQYDVIELSDYDLPLFGVMPTDNQVDDIQRWKDTVASYDGFVMITAEYNRVIPGFFKNALDYLLPELNNKAVGYVGYGGLGGLAAIQSLRLINAEQEMASVRGMVTFSINLDFENFKTFKPQDYHIKDTELMFDQLCLWTKALKTIR